MKSLPMTKRSIAFYVALLSALSMAACSHPASDEESAGGNAEAVVAEVTLTQVTRADIRRIVTVTGTVAALPNQDVKVSAQVSGRIASMTVAEGDAVKVGQVLAKIDDRTYRDQLRQAEAAAAQARASLDNAKLSQTRNESLFTRGIVSRKDLEDARTQESVAEAALRQAEAALEIAHLQVARTQILSPVNGRVVKRFAGVGEQVDGTAAQPVIEVANTSQVELLGNLPAPYLGKIKAGQEVQIEGDAPGEKPLQGKVVAISPGVDPQTNVGLVRIRIPNPAGLLRLGTYLSAPITVDTHPHALGVPPQAIYRDEQGQPRVFRVEKEEATAVPVALGIETPDRVELLSGVKEGESVILTGGYGLGDKAKVKVKP
jgi:RND family efflux transporter MFP subunit